MSIINVKYKKSASSMTDTNMGLANFRDTSKNKNVTSNKTVNYRRYVRKCRNSLIDEIKQSINIEKNVYKLLIFDAKENVNVIDPYYSIYFFREYEYIISQDYVERIFRAYKISLHNSNKI